MRFVSTDVAGVFLIEPERHPDERGFFARTWCADELRERGLDDRLAQCSVAFNHRRATLRGMHYQVPPDAEVKIVRCTAGALYDVAVDLRPDSPTFRRWVGLELTPANGRALYIPAGCAHGCQTLADRTEVAYQISARYAPASARGVRFDDPFFGVSWPLPVEVIAPRDRDYADVAPEALEALRGLQVP
jgi:dTDP-4-dehydrorhamnose 3,5-epimerase